jgi:hypothetical protein
MIYSYFIIINDTDHFSLSTINGGFHGCYILDIHGKSVIFGSG